jgi:hypothetical protein
MDEFIEHPLFSHEFIVRSQFTDFPCFHYGNAVIILDDIQTVHNGNHRALALPPAFQQILNARLRIIVLNSFCNHVKVMVAVQLTKRSCSCAIAGKY